MIFNILPIFFAYVHFLFIFVNFIRINFKLINPRRIFNAMCSLTEPIVTSKHHRSVFRPNINFSAPRGQ